MAAKTKKKVKAKKKAKKAPPKVKRPPRPPAMVTKKLGKKRPAKRPPPKRPPRLVSARSATTIELPGPDVVLHPGRPETEKQSLYAHLRALAGIVYTTDQSRPTLEQLSKREPFTRLSVDTLRRWAQDDQWVERRRAFGESVLEGVRRRIGNDLIQAQIRMLQDSAGIYDKTREMLLGTAGVDPPPAKSYESLLRAFTGLAAVLNDIRRDVIDVVVPPVTAGDAREALEAETPRVLPELSAEEARIAALAVVEARRARNKNGGKGNA